jgi:hypothetical protein
MTWSASRVPAATIVMRRRAGQAVYPWGHRGKIFGLLALEGRRPNEMDDPP